VNLENQQLLKEFDPFRRMGAEAVPCLLNVLEHPVPERDSRALFRKWLPQRLKFLAPWPKPESEQQLMALWILGEIGPAARNISANVLHYIEVPGLDYVAADALRKIGVDADIAMPMLCRSLVKQSTLDTEGVDKRRGIGHGRAPILLLLYSLGTNAQAAAPILIEEQERCLDRIRAIDKHSSTRDWDAGWLAVEKANLLYTAEALCRVSPQESQKAAPFLAKVLRDKEFFTEHTRLGLPEMKSSPNRKMVSPDARARAAQCLSEIGSLEAVLVLKDFLKDDDADVVAAAREAVQRGLSR
jgi:HEAT repeat protein